MFRNNRNRQSIRNTKHHEPIHQASENPKSMNLAEPIHQASTNCRFRCMGYREKSVGVIQILRKPKKLVGGWVQIPKCLLMLTLSMVGGSKKTKMLTDAYVVSGVWV